MSAKKWTVRDDDGDATIVEIDGDHVFTHACIEEMYHTPASARELAAALIEAADIAERVRREAEQVPDLTDPQTVHWLFDMLDQPRLRLTPKPAAPPVPDCVIEAIERLTECVVVLAIAAQPSDHEAVPDARSVVHDNVPMIRRALAKANR